MNPRTDLFPGMENNWRADVPVTGPACKIGEGSMKLHDELGNKACEEFGGNGVCTKASNRGIPQDVMFFVSPHSAALISKGLTPVNVGRY
jgi:hypothetical protein